MGACVTITVTVTVTVGLTLVQLAEAALTHNAKNPYYLSEEEKNNDNDNEEGTLPFMVGQEQVLRFSDWHDRDQLGPLYHISQALSSGMV